MPDRTAPLEDGIVHSRTEGRGGGVGNPVIFAPLTSILDHTTHYLRSDDSHPDTSTFVGEDNTETVLDSLAALPGIDEQSGWWTMDQTDGSWWGTGLGTFQDELWTAPTERPHIENTHHHGGAVWLAPLPQRVNGIEAVLFTADASDEPGDGNTLRESLRRPAVSFLLSEPEPAGLRDVASSVEMPFFGSEDQTVDALYDLAEHDEWNPNRASINFADPDDEDGEDEATDGESSLLAALTSRLGVLQTDDLEQIRTETKSVPAQSPVVECHGVYQGNDGPKVVIENPYYARQEAAVDHMTLGLNTPKVDAANLATVFAAHEYLAATPTTGGQSITAGDALKITRADLTFVHGCGYSFRPKVATVEVEPANQ